MIRSHALVAVVALVAGAATAAWRQEVVAPDVAPIAVIPAPRAVAPPAPPALPDAAVRTAAADLGCDCPLPPPDDVDPRYLEPAVEAWLTDLESRCPELAGRRTELDCSEWPCLLVVKVKERNEWSRKDLPALLTCEDPGAPSLVSNGMVMSRGVHSHLLAVRPADAKAWAHREFLRMSEMMHAEGDE